MNHFQNDSGLRVLILEDNPADAELLAYELQKAGFVFTSRHVDNKKSFIKAIKELCPDIILSDYELPTINGWEALQIRKDLCPDVPFILVTGAVGEERAIEMLTGGATDYVLKRNVSRIIPAVKRSLHEVYEHRKRKELEEERDKLFRELELRVEERTKALQVEVNAMARLHELSTVSIQEENLGPILTKIVDVAIDVSGADFGNIQFLDAETNQLTIVAQRGFPKWWVDYWNGVGRGKGACSTALRKGERVIIDDVKQSTIFTDKTALEIQIRAGVRAIQCTPLVSRLGRPLGMFSTHYRKPQWPSDRELKFLDLLARQAADIIERSQFTAALRESEEKYRLIYDSSLHGIMFTRPDDSVISANSSAQKILGMTEEEIVKAGREGIADKSDPRLDPALKERIRTGKFFGELNYRRKDGSIFPAEVSSVIMKNEKGQTFSSINFRDISIHKRNEAARRLSEEKFSVAFARNAAAMSIVRLKDGRYLDVNDAWVAIFGCHREEVIGRTSVELNLWPTLRLREHIFDRLNQTGSVSEFELTVKRRSGEDCVILLSAEVLTMADEKVILTSCLDITERKRSEERNEGQKAVISGIATIFHKALTCVTQEELGQACLAVAEEITKSKFGFIARINTRTKKIYDLAISDSGWKACGMQDPTGHEKKLTVDVGIRGLYGRVLMNGKAFFTNDPSSHPDSIDLPEGHPPLTAFLGVPIKQDNRTIGMIGLGNRAGGYGPDELASLEALAPAIMQALSSKQAEEEVRNSQNLLKAVIEGSSDPIFMKDRESRLIFGNSALFRVWGKREHEVIGKRDSDLYENPAIAEALMENDCRVMESGQSQIIEESVQTREGLRIYLSMKTPYRDVSGEIVGVIGIARDITERKGAEGDREDLIAKLELANKELESFSYSVSHDLRAPLRAIDGFSSMLMKDLESQLDEEGKRKFNLIRDNTKKMNNLIDDLLKLSRIGRTELNRKKVDMKGLAGSAWQALLDANPGITVDLKMADLPKASGDEGLLSHVFSNLLSNAAKYTRKRKKALIEVGGETNGKEAVYYVRDNGAGFDMKYYDKLFGVFQRLHPESEYEGTGVGLAIVQRIIRRHGGRVWAEGKVGKGASFYFSLPKV